MPSAGVHLSASLSAGRPRGRLTPETRGNVRVLEAAQEQAAIRNSQETNMIEVATRESAALAESQMQNLSLERSQSGGEQFPGLLGGGGAQGGGLSVSRWGGIHPAATTDPEFFPPLPGASRHQRKKQAAQRRGMAEVLGGGGSIQVLHSAAGGRAQQGASQANYPPLGGTSSNAPPPAVDQSQEAIKAANRQLVEKIRAGLGGNQILFTEFKQRSAQWQAGTMSTGQYYRYIVGVGLEEIVPQLARTCPDPQKSKELQSLHTASENERPQLSEQPRPQSAPRPSSGGRAENGRGKTAADVAASDPLIKARAKQAAADGFWPAASGGVNHSRGGSSASAGSSLAPGVRAKPYTPPGFGRGSGILGPGAGSGGLEVGLGGSASSSQLSNAEAGIEARGAAETALAGGAFAGGAFGRAMSADNLASAAGPSMTSFVHRVSSVGSIPAANGGASSSGAGESSHLREALAAAPEMWEDDGWSCSVCTLRNKAGDTRCTACGAFWLADWKGNDGASKLEEGKRKKKTGKFQRLRLGDGSIADWAESQASGGAGPSAWGGGAGGGGPGRGAAVGPQPEQGRKAFGRGAWGRGGGKRIIQEIDQQNAALAAHLRR
jgi:hypothetical protein